MITIRPATDADAPPVHELVSAAGLPTEGLDRVWRTWVATRDGEIVGTASLERHGHALLLRGVAVAASAQSEGVGARLVEHVLAERPPDTAVALLTTTAAGWFARHGFEPVPRAELDPALAASPELQGLCPDTATAMILGRRIGNGELVRRFVDEVMNRQRLEVIDELYSPKLAPRVRRWIAPFLESFPDTHMEIVDLVVGGDRVAARFRCSGTHLGAWDGHPPTGRRFERIDEVAFFRIEDGRIVEAWSLEDTAERLRQLGLIPA